MLAESSRLATYFLPHCAKVSVFAKILAQHESRSVSFSNLAGIRSVFMASERDVAEIKESLATITRLLAAQIGPDLKVAERAPLLHRLGVDRHAIAAVCG